MSAHPAVELLSSYLDEELTLAQVNEVEGHLEGCTECRRSLAGLRTVADGVARLEAVAPPPTLAASVESRVRRVSLQRRQGFNLEESVRRMLGQPVLAPVFAIILALGAILYLFSFGLSRTAPSSTRFVIASAPAEEEATVAESRSDDAALADEDASPPASEREEVLERSRVLSKEGESVGAGRAGPVPEARSAAQARQPARAASPRPAAAEPESVSSSEPVTREIAGRRFAPIEGVWVETGLEQRSAEEVLDLTSEGASVDPSLEAFRELGRVRLELDGRVVELVFREPAAG